MDNFSNVLDNACEFISGRLYFVTLNTNISPKSTACVHYFTVDTEFCYDSFYYDFGPLNLSMLYHYCRKLERKLNNRSLKRKKIVHYTGLNDNNRVNAAFLIGAYSVINLNYDPNHAFTVLTQGSTEPYVAFRDASIGDPYTLSLLNCIKAIKKALDYGFFNFNDFDFSEYEYYERVENGDLNWIVPQKFLAFCGPQNKSTIDKGYPIHSPETYFTYFRRHNVTTIIRLNKKAYDSNRFVQAGFDHKHLFFIDGGLPNDRILNRFVNICENARGAIAVHCKAGLGRTGTLIACYIMKHYKFTAEEAIAWIRICRPGSIIGHQQTWLSQKQKQLWEAGDIYMHKMKMNGPIKHKIGIYGLQIINNNNNKNNNNNNNNDNDNVTGIMKKVDSMEIHDNDDFKSEENTQGDKLNKIKIQRALTNQQPLTTNISERTRSRSKVTVTTASSSSRALRNEFNDGSRHCGQQKFNTSLIKDKNQNLIDKKGPLIKRNDHNTIGWFSKNGNHSSSNNIIINNSNGKTNLTLIVSDNNEKIIKRGKRSLVLEKDKTNPRLVKVLRRSHGQNLQDNKSNYKLRLPSVKLNNSI